MPSPIASQPRTIHAREAIRAYADQLHVIATGEDERLDQFDALDVIANIRAAADRALDEAIATAQRRGATLQQVGDHLGISRSAVWNRLDRADLLAPR